MTRTIGDPRAIVIDGQGRVYVAEGTSDEELLLRWIIGKEDTLGEGPPRLIDRFEW